jgi:hypothetical protein
MVYYLGFKVYIILSMILGFAVLNTVNAATDGLIPKTIVTKTPLRELLIEVKFYAK